MSYRGNHGDIFAKPSWKSSCGILIIRKSVVAATVKRELQMLLDRGELGCTSKNRTESHRTHEVQS